MLQQARQQLLNILRGGHRGLYRDKVAQLSNVLRDCLHVHGRNLSDRERVRLYCVHQIVGDVARRMDALSSNPTIEAHNQLSATCMDPLSELFEHIDSANVATFETAAATAIVACNS